MEVLQKQKTGLSLDVEFNKEYKDPIVIVSPFWDRERGDFGQLAYPSTITAIHSKGCRIQSGNHADNYFVNILVMERLPYPIGLNSLMVAESKKKNDKTETIHFDQAELKNEPVMLLSSFWNGTDSEYGVQPVDTIVALNKIQANVTSENMADNYNVNYAIFQRSLGKIPSDQNRGLQYQANTINKTGTGTLRIFFAKPFKKAPVIFISPWWEGNPNAVTNVPTTIRITNEYFEVISKNAASNYFLHWLAIES